MPQTPIHLLILNDQVKFSTTLKRTLEQLGDFDAIAFTTANAVFEYLRDRPLDVAMIDLGLEDSPAIDVILRLRQLYPELAVIVSPLTEQSRGVVEKYDLQGVIDIPISARRLIPILQKAVTSAQDSLPETSPAPPGIITPPPLKPVEAAELAAEQDAAAQDAAAQDVEQEGTPEAAPSTPSEQPSDGQPTDAQATDAQPQDEQPHEESSVQDEPERDELVPENTKAETLKEFSPFDMLSNLSLSMDEVPVDVGEEGTSTIEVDMGELLNAEDAQPLSTEEQAALVFEKLLAEEPPMKLEDSGTLRDLGQEMVVSDTGARQVIEILRDNKTIAPPPPPVPIPDDDDNEIPILARQFLKDMADKETPLEALEVAATAATEMDEDEATEHEIELGKSSIMQPVQPGIEPKTAPELANLALRMTQASMELTAEASLLSEEGQVVAAAGDMPPEDIDELKAIIAGDWEADQGKSRIRFITLESSGKDYMLFSRKTDFGYTLTMIFAGNMPLRVIRRQSDRLVTALGTESSAELAPAGAPLTTPDAEIADSQQVSAYTGEMVAYSFVILVHHTHAVFSAQVAQAITAGLQNRLKKKDWDIQELLVAEDYVYIYARIPVHDARRETVNELQKIAGNLANARDSSIEPEALWAKAYFALTPGRTLPVEEIHRFVRFAQG